MTHRFRFFHSVHFLLLFGMCPGAFAQQTIRFSHLGILQGLSQSAVNCIFQDRRGFMWFGTQDGLNRFDGYTFTVFKHDPVNPQTLNDNFIYSIREDSAGTLWIGTMSHPEMLNRYEPATETFSQVSVDSVDLQGARGTAVMSTYTDPSGALWSGSIGGGLTRKARGSKTPTVYKNNPADPQSLSDNRVYSVYGDRSGTVWVGTKGGLNRLDPGSKSFVRYRHSAADSGSLADNWVWPICEDRRGTLWVGTAGGGLHRLDRATGTFTRYRHNGALPTSLSDDAVLSIYQDRSGVLWVGTSNDGLNLFHPEQTAFRNFTKDPSDRKSLIDNTVISLLVDRTGTAWIGTRGGLSQLNRKDDTFTHFTANPSNPRTIAENSITSLLEDRSGGIWVGCYSSGLDFLDRHSGVFTHYHHNPADPASLSDNRVYALLEDEQGILWVGTYGGGLNRFDRSTGKFRLYSEHDTIPGSISANGVWALCEDRSGVLWAGTYGGGLNRFDRKTERFTSFRFDKDNPRTISDDNILCIMEDRSGILWVGTLGGLNRFDPAAGTFRRYRERDGLPNDVVLGILEDNSGNLWISTNKGLAKFHPSTGTFRTFDASDGLQGNEFNQNAYARNPLTGEMYFGGASGFTVFHPDSVHDNPYIPPVVFSAYRRYNTDDTEGKPIEEKGIFTRSAVRLTYKDNIATFEFAALNFHNTFRNQYAYRLEGFSDSWIQLGREHRATFTNLDPGEYILRVKGSNNDGVWNEQGTALTITVTPPWWRTTWAYAFYGLFLMSALYGVRRVEINRREQKTRVRESELRAKAAEAEKRALAAENERQTKELEEARTLQLSMLPQEVPKLPHLEIAVFMRTATEVGGDYYDFQTADDGSLLVAFGDATGHGMQAGTIVTLMKGMFTSDASRLDIRSFFNHCSRSIKGIRLGRLLMAFSLMKLSGRTLSYSSAGMPPLFIHRRKTGGVDEILLKGMPLGAMKNFPYAVHEEGLDPGDTLLLLTDGLPEQKNRAGDMFDYERLRTEFQGIAPQVPEDIIRHLVAAGDSWMSGAAQEDDITIMVIRMKDEELRV
jgi:two-component system sensor histidine kinase ChiS